MRLHFVDILCYCRYRRVHDYVVLAVNVEGNDFCTTFFHLDRSGLINHHSFTTFSLLIAFSHH